jgi:hypothetical protein
LFQSEWLRRGRETGFESAAFRLKSDGRESLSRTTVTNVAPSVTFYSPDALRFEVVVRGPRGDSRHQVSTQADEAKRWAKLAPKPSRCVGTAMRFPLDREPKESILSMFDMRAVRRYFPELDAAFLAYLVRVSGERRTSA